jgi:hypothetical protein
VTISGSNLAGAYAVYFGDVPAASFTFNADGSITAVTPPHTAGATDVRVATFSGTSPASPATRFTFTLPATSLTVTSLTVNNGTNTGGTALTIYGSGFLGAQRVLFGGVDAASFQVVSDSRIDATSPTHAPGAVDVVVVTPAGTSPTSANDEFSYAPLAPNVTGLSSTSGGNAGGTLVTVTGSNFTGASAVLFGSLQASFTVNSDTSITVVVPANGVGTVDVTVQTDAGPSGNNSNDKYTYNNTAPTPAITNLSPTSGSVVGGTVVTILGSGFTGASAVSFGSIAALSFSVISDGVILASAPPGTLGKPVDVVVTAPGGTSPTGSADQFTYLAVTAPAVTGLSATSGSTAGGTTVTLSGSGFLGATGVFFGGVAAASVLVLSDTSLLAVTPALPAGTLDVTVTIPGATSALGKADRFTFTAAAAPAVNGVVANMGSTAGGLVVTISGTGLTGATGVSFGGVAATFVVVSDTTITATVPPSAQQGPVDVIVSTPTGTSPVSSADQFTYSLQSPPNLTLLNPTSVSGTGGVVVNLTGTGFTGATGVTFDSVAVPFTVQSDTWIIATAPAHTAVPVSVIVTTPGGPSGSLPFSYSPAAPAPTITTLTPTTGTTAGGDVVTILGTGFTTATDVQFGGTSAPSFQVLSDTAITVVVPAGTAGAVNVTVVTVVGSASLSSAFTYGAPSPPTVTGIGQMSGPIGTVVIITGSGFTTATAVSFGSYSASFTINNDSQITAVAPAQGMGPVNVTVTTAAGTATASNQFTYTTTTPTLTALSPAAGPLVGGNAIAISGTGFLGATGVSFGGAPALSFTVQTDSVIFAVVPAGTGTVDVQVTTPGGSATLSGSYTYQAAPTDSLLSPNSGSTAGGIPVVITGTGLTGALAVYFGDVAATGFTVTSDTSLTVTVPAHLAGAVNVVVLTPGGATAPLTFTYTGGGQAPIAPSTINWVGGNGDWSDRSHWSGGALPTSTSDVVIPVGVIVSHSAGTDTVHKLSVAGTLVVSGGILSVSNTGSLAALTLSGGVLGGTGALTVTGTWAWTGGTLNGSGSLTLASGATGSLSAGGGTLALGLNVSNQGQVSWAGSGTFQFYGAALWDNPGTFTVAAGASFRAVAGVSGGTFKNGGTFVLNSAGGASFAAGVSFNNTGGVQINAGTLSLAAGTSSGTVSGAGALSLSGYTLTAGSSVSTSLAFTGASSTLAGTVSGTVTVQAGATVTSAGATITGNLSNAGTLSLSAGALSVSGNYTQTSAATLNLVIAGPTAGSQYGQLRVGGQATLAGTLTVTFAGGFTPPAASSFTLLTYGSRSGAFAAVRGTTKALHYNSTDATLAALLPGEGEEGESPDAPPAERPEERALAQRARAADDDEPAAIDAVASAGLTHVVFTEGPGQADREVAPQDTVFRELAEGTEATAGPAAPDLAWDDLLALPLTLLEAVLDVV